MTYTITLTEKQLRIMWRALETWERMMMGQFWDFTDELAEAAHDYRDEDGRVKDKAEFDCFIRNRDDAKAMMEAAHKVCCRNSWLKQKTPDMLIAEDMWTAIRYKLWQDKPEPKPHDTVASGPPLHSGSEPPIKVEVEDAE